MILFLGSGFSLDAKNKNGDNFPTGEKLSSLMWNFLGYPGDYDGTQNRVKTGIEMHPYNRMLNTIYHAVSRAYLNLGLDRDDIEDPEIPNFNR